jgi:tetratricopeptide (TPR) repeat protein
MPIEHPKILCLFSAPLVGPTGAPLSALDVAAEQTAIVRELTALNRGLTLRIGFATTDELALGIADRFNILHLSGHGHPDFLVFEDGKGGSQPVGGDYLKRLIGTGGPFELAVVSACHSEPLAQKLVEAGVRHAVAIRCDFPVLDTAATAFIKEFYRSLFRGEVIQKAFEMAKLLVEGNPELMKIKPYLQMMAGQEGEPYVPEEDKFLLLPTGDPSFHLGPLISGEIAAGEPLIERPKVSRHNLPVRPRSFTGRSGEMHELINELLSNRFVTVTGTGGTGKTTLAVEVARWFQARGHFPDGIWMLNLRQAETAGGIIAMLAAVLEAEVSELKDVVNLLRSDQCLLLFDNAEDALWKNEDETREVIDVILKYCPQVKLLITSQRQVGGNLHEPERIVRLTSLDLQYAARLFAVTAKRYLKQEEWESGAFASLMRQLQGHPLAIVLMARQLDSGKSIEDLNRRIQQHKAEAIQVKTMSSREPRHEESLIASLASAYNAISDEAQILFQIMAMLPAGAFDFTIQEIFGDTGWEYAQELHDAALAEISDQRRLVLLQPVRLYALNTLGEETRKIYGPKILSIMASYAVEFYLKLSSKEAKEYRFAFTIEEPNMRAAVDLPCQAAKNTKEPSALGWLAPHLIALYRFLDRVAEAEEVGNLILQNLKKLKDTLGQANALIWLGELSLWASDLEESRERYEKALEICDQIDYKLGQAHALLGLGQYLAVKNEFVAAEEKIEKADEIYKDIDESYGQSEVLMVRAFFCFNRRRNSEAIEKLDQCISLRAPNWSVPFPSQMYPPGQAYTEGYIR